MGQVRSAGTGPGQLLRQAARARRGTRPLRRLHRMRRGLVDGLSDHQPSQRRDRLLPSPATRRRSCCRPTAPPRGSTGRAVRCSGAAASARARRYIVEPGRPSSLYTDGLVERRGESLDEGMARLVDGGDAEAGGAPTTRRGGSSSESARRGGSTTTSPSSSCVPRSLNVASRRAVRWQPVISISRATMLDVAERAASRRPRRRRHGPSAARADRWSRCT